MVEGDLLAIATGPLVDPLRGWLGGTSVPAPIREALGLLADSVPLVVVAGVFAVIGLGRGRQVEAEHDTRRGSGLALVSAGFALLLGWWLVRHPSTRFDDLFKRGDHLAFAGFTGLALEPLASAGRKWVLAVVSCSVLLQYAGAVPVGIAVGTSILGLALARGLRGANRYVATMAHAALIGLAYAVAFRLRHTDFLTAASVQGLLAFWILRHLSLLVHARRMGIPAPGDCAAYMTFYPGAMGLAGAPEVYEEFARRNLARRARLDQTAGARRLVEAVLLVVVSRLVPVSLERVEQSTSAPLAWGLAILFFVRTALVITGIWRSVEVTALFYGIRMRANFAGLLSCRNPSELWWAWRGTLTNWLVHHVYAPLGANRRHQALNILAAFLVSFGWHALGVPFVSPGFRIAEVAGVGLWAGVNAAAVIAHVTISRTSLPALTTGAPAWLRVSVATGLTWALGSLTPILLSYQGPAVDRLPHLLRVLLGVG